MALKNPENQKFVAKKYKDMREDALKRINEYIKKNKITITPHGDRN